MKKLSTFLMIFALSCACLFADEKMKVSAGAVSAELPVGWIAQYAQTPILFYFYSPAEENDTFQENINITVETLPSKYTPSGYIDNSLTYLKTLYSDFEIVKKENDSVLLQGAINGIAVKQYIKVIIKGKVAYSITASSTPTDYERYESVFKEILSSVKIK